MILVGAVQPARSTGCRPALTTADLDTLHTAAAVAAERLTASRGAGDAFTVSDLWMVCRWRNWEAGSVPPPYPFNTTFALWPRRFLRPDHASLARRLETGWCGTARATAPADRRTAEAAIEGLYQLVGMPAPPVVWLDSPATGRAPTGFHWSGYQNPDQELEFVPDAVDQHREDTGVPVLHRLRGQSRYEYDRQPPEPPDPARDSRWARRRFVRWWRTRVRAEWDRRWTRRLALWNDLTESCGGWWPFERMCFVSERPAEVYIEPTPGQVDLMRLHRADGPAMRYRDGWAMHALHGEWVADSAIEWLRTRGSRRPEANADVRSCIECGSIELIKMVLATDFQRTDLRGLVFPADCHLQHANFDGADLREVNFCGNIDPGLDGASLIGATFVDADLRGATLGGIADLAETDLTRANLAGIRFDGAPEIGFASMANARLIATNLAGAYPFGVNISGVVWNDDTVWPTHLGDQIRAISDRQPDGTWRVRPRQSINWNMLHRPRTRPHHD